MGERAAAHEGKRRDLDLTRLHAAGNLLRRHHVVQGVVERSQVRVDLLLHVAGQEPQPLAGLHRRPRQHDALDLAGQKQRHPHGDSKVGLAAAGRTQRKHHVTLAKRCQVVALSRRAGLHGTAARADAVLVAALGTRPRKPHCGVDVGHFDRQSALQALVERGQRLVRHGCIVRRTGDGKLVAARAQLDIRQLFDAYEVAVVIAVERRHQHVVVERHAADVGRPDASADGRSAHAATPKGPPARTGASSVTISPARLSA